MANGLNEPLPDSTPDVDAPGPDLRALLGRGLSRSLGWVVGLTVVGAVAGLWVGITQPNLYVSTTKLLLRVGARELVSSESMIGSDEEPRLTGPTMADEMQMLSDSAIFERVARNIGPQEILGPADPSRDDSDSTPLLVSLMHGFQKGLFGVQTLDHACTGDTCWSCLRQATKELQANTSITNELGSNVIVVNVVSTSPDKARVIAQGLADAFIERHREQFSIQSLVERNRGKVEQAKEDRDAAASAYVEHVNRTAATELDTLSPAYVTELSALEKELFDARLQLEQVRRKRASLTDRALEEPAPVLPSGPQIMVPNQEYESRFELKRSLTNQRLALAASDLAGAQELDRRIDDLDRLLAKLPKTVAMSADQRQTVEEPVSAGRAELEIEEKALEVKVQMLDARYSEKKQTADEIRQRGLLSDLKLKDLASARDNAESRYRQMQGRFSVLEALSAIDINEDANLRVMQAPTSDRDKVGPKRVSLLLKGLIAGLLLGAVIAVMRQQLDTRLRYPDLFEKSYGLPVLGVVPQLSALRRLPRSSSGETG